MVKLKKFADDLKITRMTLSNWGCMPVKLNFIKLVLYIIYTKKLTTNFNHKRIKR